LKYELIVFDWDGTLYDSAAFIVSCVQAAAQASGFPVPEEKTIREMIGLSYEESLKRMMPDVSPMQMAMLIKAYRKCVEESQTHAPVLFQGVEEVLKSLKATGYYLAIATGKGRYGLNKDLELLKLSDTFVTTRCSDETNSKPHPQMLLEIMDEMGVEPSKTLMIGDTEYDMQLAQNAKTDAMAVSYGAHHIDRLRSGEHVKGYLDDIRDLPPWLARKSIDK